MRQPAVTGVPLTSCSAGAACATPSLNDVAHRLLDAEPAGGDAAVLQALRDPLVRALVFLPGPHVGGAGERAGGELLARAVLLERRADHERLAGLRA